jgi:hypothetical protein
MPQDFYTEAEIEQLRLQLKNGNKLVKAAVEKLGIKVHPKILEAKAKLAKKKGDENV